MLAEVACTRPAIYRGGQLASCSFYRQPSATEDPLLKAEKCIWQILPE